MTPAIRDWFRLLTAFPRLLVAAWCLRTAMRLLRWRWRFLPISTALVRFGVAIWPHDPIR